MFSCRFRIALEDWRFNLPTPQAILGFPLLKAEMERGLGVSRPPPRHFFRHRKSNELLAEC